MSGEAEQVAALPYRMTLDGCVEVLLITTRKKGNFSIPKGWPNEKEPQWRTASKEAWEESGVYGGVSDKPFEKFEFWKRKRESYQKVRVSVFLLKVKSVADTWPEFGERTILWCPISEAVETVDECGLQAVLVKFASVQSTSPDWEKNYNFVKS